MWNVIVVEIVGTWRESECSLTTSIHNQFEKKKPSLVENKRGCCNRDKNTVFLKLQREKRERFTSKT